MDHCCRVNAGGFTEDSLAHNGNPLAHACRRSEYLHLSVFHRQSAPSAVNDPHAFSAVFPSQGNPRIRVGLKNILHRLQTFRCSRALIGDLSVRQDLSRTDGVPIADFPGGDPNLFRQKIQILFHGKITPGRSEPPKRPGHHIVGINRHAQNIHILIIVRPCRMGTRPVKHRTSKRRISPRIGDNDCFHSRQYPVFVTGRRDLDLHGVAFGVVSQALLSGKFYLNRFFRIPGHKRRMVLHAHILLAAETSAYQHGVAADLFPGDL